MYNAKVLIHSWCPKNPWKLDILWHHECKNFIALYI